MAADEAGFVSRSPVTGETLVTFESHSIFEVDDRLQHCAAAQRSWRESSFQSRAAALFSLAEQLSRNVESLAALVTAEMGKPVSEARGEIEKCAWACRHFGEHGAGYLEPEPREVGSRDCYVQFLPIGVVLGIMPWNFPFWQVFRFAAPAVMAGNAVLLKHSPNVPQCALKIEDLFLEAGFPGGLVSSVFVPTHRVEQLIDSPHIAAVTLTGSVAAGRSVAAAAAARIKKAVLELGGSDPFIVLPDADLGKAVEAGILSRFQNSGQSCIAAKRFIVDDSVYREFETRFVEAVRALEVGDPMVPTTRIGPLARADLRETLDRQVKESVARGGRVLCGGAPIRGTGFFYSPTVVANVTPEMPLFQEEVFGPVAALIRARDLDHALELANQTEYGLGASLWTTNLDLAGPVSRRLDCGQLFVNGVVASDPRLPFGGVKASGFGRELSAYGIKEFVNVQTVWIGPKSG